MRGPRQLLGIGLFERPSAEMRTAQGEGAHLYNRLRRWRDCTQGSRGVWAVFGDRQVWVEFISSRFVTPHAVRHTKAMHLLQAGVNLIYGVVHY